MKQQLNRCRKADNSIQKDMYEEFIKELRDLNNKNLISWRGHKLSRYWQYKKLIKQPNKEISSDFIKQNKI